MPVIRRSFVAAAVLSLVAAFGHAGEPAPTQVAEALKQLAPATLAVDRVEFVRGSDRKFLIAGRADRNVTVSNYLRALDASAEFEDPELLQIAMNPEGRPMFEITVERRVDPDGPEH